MGAGGGGGIAVYIVLHLCWEQAVDPGWGWGVY